MATGISRFVLISRREGRGAFFLARIQKLSEKAEHRLVKRIMRRKPLMQNIASIVQFIEASKSLLTDGMLLPAVIEKVKTNPETLGAQVSQMAIRSLFCKECEFIKTEINETQKAIFECVLSLKQPQAEAPRLYWTHVSVESKSGEPMIKKIDFIRVKKSHNILALLNIIW